MKRSFQQLALAVSICLLFPRPSQGVGPTGIGNDNPTGVTGDFNGNITTGGSYDPYTGNAKRFVTDLTVTASLGAYPLKWTRILNSRGTAGVFGHGGGWTHSYQWTLWLRPDRVYHYYPPGPYEGPDGALSYPDGRVKKLRVESDLDYHWLDDALEPEDRLVAVDALGNYDLVLADGGRVEFRHDGTTRPIHTYGLKPRRIIDPHELVTDLQRDPMGRLWRIIEPGGSRYLEISYRDYPSYIISKVEAFARSSQPTEAVTYNYIPETVGGTYGPVTYYNLTGVTYADGPPATYTYFQGNGHNYVPGRIKTCDDPRFAGAMGKIEYVYYYAQGSVVGQIKAEKYPDAPTFVSEVIYPPFNPTVLDRHRTEKRPDGRERTFEYSDDGLLQLERYTDFKGKPSTIVWTGDGAGYTRTLTDPRLNRSAVTKEYVAGAVLAVTRGNSPPSQSNTVFYAYTDAAAPYYLASKTDERGKITSYTRYPGTHPSKNRIQQINYPDEGWESFTYNHFGQVLEHRMTSGGTEYFEYDERGLKTSYTPPATLSDPTPGQNKTFYFYYGGDSGPGNAPAQPVRPDLIDRLRRVIDPLGNSTWYEYNARGQVTKVIHDDGTFTQSDYKADGTVEWTENELGHRTTYIHDEYKRLIRVTNPPPLNQTVINSYAPWTGHGPLSHTTSSVYRTISHMQKITDYDYDANFRRERITVAPGTEDVATTTNTYDDAGNLWKVKDPKGQATGRETIYEYDDRNRKTSVTDTLGHRTEWQYDNAGNMTRETRADTKFRTWDEYDAMNRIKHTTGFLNEPTSYEYNLAGNQTRMTDANGRVYQTTYDELNRKKTSSYPTDATGLSRSESWRYDIAGNLKRYKNQAHQHKHFQYDARNRLRRSYWNVSDTDIMPADWTIGPETATTPDAASRVLEIKTNLGQTIVAYGYDNANRKIWEDQTVAGLPTRRVATAPDDDGNRGTLSVAGVPTGYPAYSVSYQYTQRQQLREINRGEGLKIEFSHDVNGNLTRRQHMAPGHAHDATRFQYDDANRVTLCEQTGHNDVPFSRANYNDYDLVNNLLSISRQEDGDKGEIFEYDEANQLKKVSYRVDVVPRGPEPGEDPGAVAPVGEDEERKAVAALAADPGREPLAAAGAQEPDAPTEPRTVTYTNDAINRLSMSDNGTVTDYAPNHLNQYTAVTGQQTPGYDEKFSLSEYNDWTYVYDAEKRLISASKTGHSAQFVYDGLGRCVKRTIDAVTTVLTYDEWKPIVEWKGDGTFWAWNLYGPGADEILVRFQPNIGGAVHYHLDPLGNVQFLLSGEEHLGLEKYTYDAFGKPTIMGWYGNVRAISSHGNRFLFTGREYLYTLGVYDYRNRVYHPGLGRFMQVDPIGFKGDSLNLYRYCGSNPINRGDPEGLQWHDRDSRLDSRGGGNWIGDSNGLSYADIQDHFPRAGPDGGGGGGGGDRGSGSMSSENEGKKPVNSKHSGAPESPDVIGDRDIERGIAATDKKMQRLIQQSGMDPKKMTFQQKVEFLWRLDTEFRFRGPFDYRGSLAPRGIYSGNEINYIGVGRGMAAVGWTYHAHRWTANYYHNIVVNGELPTKGKLIWMEVGYHFPGSN